jgi:hypothetical protein
MREKLSSSLTRAIRWGLPAIFVGAFGLGILASWTIMDPPNPPALSEKILATVWWAVVAAAVVWFTRPLREVWIEDDRLVVSAGADDWLVPLSAVEQVSENPLLNPRLVTLRVRLPSGEVVPVRFLARSDMFLMPTKTHPAVAALRERVDAARQLTAGTEVR